ncbi:F-box-like/WD repeat-containing protein TBL1XR1 [Trichoplax sp. H2]|nr:F-box-like/WD repeat-containing protein TBL1XR1 [Trichoplax sp. H2]|eukprot:RDD46597.1 F-box-like/WD repeat-containing protein TBL1XR1 [Trichoplax sp. H2]
MNFTSEELNYLIYRYLQESGFHHSCYTFGIESHIHRSNINGSSVPPGALISMVQKGMLYYYVDMTLKDEKNGENQNNHNNLENISLIDSIGKMSELSSGNLSYGVATNAKNDQQLTPDSQKKLTKDSKREENSDQRRSSESDVHSNSIHNSEIFAIKWHPNKELIATGSSDGTAKISQPNEVEATVLEHYPNEIDKRQPEASNGNCGISDRYAVTSIVWKPDGSQLLTACADGKGRIWQLDGKLVATLSNHTAPIFVCRWNIDGSLIAMGSADMRVTIWDSSSYEMKQCCDHHKGPVTDIDWQNVSIFATCSTDRSVAVCEVGSEKPIKSYEGHTSEINVVRWDPSSNLLASGSDDCTVKVWNLKQDKCVHDFRGHVRNIYAIKWCPVKRVVSCSCLASASADRTIRIWDVDRGICLYTLNRHQSPVYSLAFNSDGRLLASGSYDTAVNIWSLENGLLVRTVMIDGPVSDIDWHKDNRIVAVSGNGSSYVIDMRKNY